MTSHAATIDQPSILLRVQNCLAAADSNFTMATAFHEVWLPAINDAELHARMSNSYAGQAFLIIRTALRREMILALMRVWDEAGGARSLKYIFLDIGKAPVWKVLLRERVEKLRNYSTDAEAEAALLEKRTQLSHLYGSYMRHGPKEPAYKRIKALRDQHLAHTQASPTSSISVEPFDAEVQRFYDDTATLVSGLMSLINGEAHDFRDTAGVYHHYATRFWQGSYSETSRKSGRSATKHGAA